MVDISGPATIWPSGYFGTLRTSEPGRRWLSVLAVLIIAVSYLTLSAVLSSAAMLFDYFTGRSGPWSGRSMADLQLTPAVLLAANLAPALMIPLVIIVERLFHRRSGLLHSVTGRFRWRWFLRVTIWLAPFCILYGVAGSFIFPQQGGPGPAPQWLALLIIVLLTTPLQAAGEEYLFRGFLGRVVGSWFGSAKVAVVVGTVVSSVLFMIAHGAADPWLIGYYLVFGAALAVTTWQTGGLEASIAIHALNNVVMFVAGILLTDGAGAFDRSAGTGGPSMVVAMVLVPAFGLLAVVLGRRSGLSRATTVASADVPSLEWNNA